MRTNKTCITCGKPAVNAHFKLCHQHNQERLSQAKSNHRKRDSETIEANQSTSKKNSPTHSLHKKSSKFNRQNVRVKTPILYYCSNGARVSQAEIKAFYEEARERRMLRPHHMCDGCGKIAHSFAHIVAKARCKVIHKTELIWSLDNFFPACLKCNSAIENPKGEAWKQLNNIDHCLTFIQQHDKELHAKFMVNSEIV